MDIFNLFGGCLFVKIKKCCGSSVKIDAVVMVIHRQKHRVIKIISF
jgi:hypothetical protein